MFHWIIWPHHCHTAHFLHHFPMQFPLCQCPIQNDPMRATCQSQSRKFIINPALQINPFRGFISKPASLGRFFGIDIKEKHNVGNNEPVLQSITKFPITTLRSKISCPRIRIPINNQMLFGCKRILHFCLQFPSVGRKKSRNCVIIKFNFTRKDLVNDLSNVCLSIGKI